MNLHIHTGPGHHEKILMNELKRHKISFSYSLYHPRYEYGFSKKGKGFSVLSGSQLYDITNKWIWRTKRLIPFLKKTKKYQDITYPLFDAITSKKLGKETLLFAWPQMSYLCMQQVKKSGGINILEYPIAHIASWKKYIMEEGEHYGVHTAYSFFTKRMEERMYKEIELADFISIPSTFVKTTFLENGVAENKLLVNPYGIDSDYFIPEKKKLKGEFVVIAVGSVEIRKGFQYLLQAFDELRLPNAVLKIIGKVNPHFHKIQSQYIKNPSIKFLGNLSKKDASQEMRQADMKVMPSLVEGLSLVILESMASGTPVISSENAGGLDVIDEGKDGFIVPIRDVEKLKEKLEWGYHNREKLVSMGILARNKILDHFTIQKYGDRASSIFGQFLTPISYE